MPRSTRPCTTVPRRDRDTSCIGKSVRPVPWPAPLRYEASTASISSLSTWPQPPGPCPPGPPRPALTTGCRRPESASGPSSAASLQLATLDHRPGSSTTGGGGWFDLVHVDPADGTPTWRATDVLPGSAASPSAADTTRVAPSICAAPFMFVMVSRHTRAIDCA